MQNPRTEIDYVDSLHGSSFVFKNPNAKTTCGCGGSFERIEDWLKKCLPYGWEGIYSEYFGYDHPTINDVHQLYVFER